MGAPPCDLENLGEVIKFTMQSCEDANIICEYAAGTLLGKWVTFLAGLNACTSPDLLRYFGLWVSQHNFIIIGRRATK